MLGEINVEGFVVDYERVLWRAISHVYPETIINGCVFHWGKAVWRKVQDLGLATQYISDKGTHIFVRKLLSLPFLPAEHIEPTFNTLRDFNACDALESLLDYIESVWMKSSVWPVENWCVYGQSVRTNNDLEGWHRRLNHRVGVSPPFHILIRQLHVEGLEVRDQVDLVGKMALRRIQRKCYRLAQAKLFEAWDSYREGQLITTGLQSINYL